MQQQEEDHRHHDGNVVDVVSGNDEPGEGHCGDDKQGEGHCEVSMQPVSHLVAVGVGGVCSQVRIGYLWFALQDTPGGGWLFVVYSSGYAR